MKNKYFIKIFSRPIAFVTTALVLLLMQFYSNKASAQCTARTLTWTNLWASTSFGTCTPTLGGWTTHLTGTHTVSDGFVITEEGSSINCTPTPCEGGNFPDAVFESGNGDHPEQATARMTSPPVNTTGYSSVTLTFLHYYAASCPQSGTINVQTSNDLTNWTTVWTHSTGSVDIDGSGGITVNISNANLNQGTTYFSFYMTSNELFCVAQWWINNVKVTGVVSPTITSFTPSSGCAGTQSITITGTDLSGATSVTVGGTPVQSITSNSATQIVVVVGSGTTGVITVTTPNGTTSSTGTFTVDPAPATPGAISGPTTVCSGSVNTYSVTAVSGATSYTWTLPTGWTGTSTSNSISATQGTGGGNITVTANNACGSSPAQTLAVNLGAAPATPGTISGPASVCANSTNTFSVAAVTGATSYTWTLPTGWSGSSITNSINATEGTGGGTISVTANNACGSSSPQTTVVSIASVPVQPGTISGPASSCSGSLNAFSVVSVSGATSYTWTLPGGWTGTSTTNSISATSGSAGGNISVTANNACGSSTAQTLAVSVTTAPATPAAITGPANVCNSSSSIFSVVPVNGATSYTWTLPNGWTGTSTTDSITATTGATGGTVSVTANGACGSSGAQTLAVSVTSILATPGPISGPTTICSGVASTFSVAPVSGATSYTWTLPNGWTGSSTTNSISATPGSSGGTVSVVAVNSCATSTPQTLAVTISTVPVTPGSITGADSVCSGSQNTYSIPTVSGATSYTWTLPNSWTGGSVSESVNTTAGSSGGTISVVTNNACGSSTAQTLLVVAKTVPATPGPITGSDSVCNGASNTYSVAAVTGASSYTWTLPNGWTGSSTTNSIITVSGSTGGTISVTANSSCGNSTAQTLTVTIGGTLPGTPGPINGPDSLCDGSSALYSVAPVAGATSYIWNLPSDWSGASSTDSINVTGSIGSGQIMVMADNGCGQSAAQSKSVTLNPTPTVTFTFPKNPVCSNSAAFPLSGGAPAGGVYSGQGVIAGTFIPSSVSEGNYLVTYTYITPLGCPGSDTSSAIVTVCNDIENTSLSQIAVYPNPFGDELIIDTKGNYLNGTAVLMDALGRDLRIVDLNKGFTEVQINTSGLAKGAYLLKIVVDGNVVAVRKVFRVE